MSAFAEAVRGGTQYHRDEVWVSTSVNDTTPAFVVARPEVSVGWSEVIDDLLAAYKLTDDWDGQGAKAPSQEVLVMALKLAESLKKTGLPHPDECGPSVNGEVTFYWKWATASLVFEVTPAARVLGYKWLPGARRAVQLNSFGPTEFGS